MWIFLDTGFYSTVVNQRNPEELMVRARCAADLAALRAKYMPQLSETLHTPDGDYVYRAFITRQAFAEGMASYAEALDYTNFKNRVSDELGSERSAVYQRVWSALVNYFQTGIYAYARFAGIVDRVPLWQQEFDLDA